MHGQNHIKFEIFKLKKNGTRNGLDRSLLYRFRYVHLSYPGESQEQILQQNLKGRERDTDPQCYRDNIWQVPAPTYISGIPEAKHRA